MLVEKGIKAIFFDLDGTLRFSDPAPRVSFITEAVRLGLSVSMDDRLRVARWEHYYFGGSDEIHVDRAAFPDNPSFWMNYCRRQLVALGAPPSLADELAAPLHNYMGEHYRSNDTLMPHVQQTLDALKNANVLLGVVSNREEPYHDYLHEIGLAEYFHFSLAAGEVKSWKPDRQIFEHALRIAGVKAEETFYVGDNYFADVVGARNAGLKPILIDVDGVFEQPDCPVVCSHQQLLDLLQHGDAWAGKASETRPVQTAAKSKEDAK